MVTLFGELTVGSSAGDATTTFNGDVSRWDTGRVTTLAGTFERKWQHVQNYCKYLRMQVHEKTR